MNDNETCKEDILIELYIKNNMPSSEDFIESCNKEFELESIQRVCKAGDKTKRYVDNMLEVVHDLRALCRKEQAKMIRTTYRTDSALVFSILDNKELTVRDWFTLIKQRIE